MKRILIISVLSVVSLCGFSQSRIGTFSIIPKLGVGLGKLSSGSISFISDNKALESDTRFRPGLEAGLEAEYQFASQFSASVGVMYSQQGCKYKNINMESSNNANYTNVAYSDITQQMHYINVPIMLNCYIAEGLAVKAGVQLGYLFDTKFKYTETPYNVSKLGEFSYGTETSYNINTDDYFKAFDVSIPIGVSYENQNVVIDARYNLGLTNISKSTDNKNRFFTFTVGYKFDFIK